MVCLKGLFNFALFNADSQKNMRYLLYLGVFLFILLPLIVYFFQKRLLYLPDQLDKNHVFRFNHPFEEVDLVAKDGVKINTLYFKTTKVSKGVVLYFHGNANNMQRWAANYIDFTSKGYDFYIIDYRGYGKSEGVVNEEDFYSDARMVYDKLREQYAADSIVIFGRSLGSGVAANLAAQVPAQALILETPYKSIKDVIRTKFPFILLPFALPQRFPNHEFLPKVNCPIYILQGTDDEIVPFQSAIKLKPLLKPTDEFIIFEGGKHKGLSQFELYHQKLNQILNHNKEK